MRQISLLLSMALCALYTFAEPLEGDAARGERVFWQCRTCHYPEKGLGHNNGPSLWSIYGQTAGSQAGFDYSPVLQQASFSWTPALMDVWLRDPARFMPGNRMMSPGIPDAQQRADLIDYLKRFAEP